MAKPLSECIFYYLRGFHIDSREKIFCYPLSVLPSREEQ
jgi:hypothetical protein